MLKQTVLKLLNIAVDERNCVIMVKAGIIGSTGYAGQELVRILLQHPGVEIVWYGSKSYIDKKYSEVFGNMFQIVDDICMGENIEELAGYSPRIVRFTC